VASEETANMTGRK